MHFVGVCFPFLEMSIVSHFHKQFNRIYHLLGTAFLSVRNLETEDHKTCFTINTFDENGGDLLFAELKFLVFVMNSNQTIFNKIHSF